MRIEKLKGLIYEHIIKHPPSVAGGTLWGWIRRSNEGYTLHEYDIALLELRNENVLACTNKKWWVRKHNVLAKCVANTSITLKTKASNDD